MEEDLERLVEQGGQHYDLFIRVAGPQVVESLTGIDQRGHADRPMHFRSIANDR